MKTAIFGVIMLVLGGVAYLFRVEFVSLGMSSRESNFAGMAIMADGDYRLAYDILTYAGIGVAALGLILLVVGILKLLKARAPAPPAAAA
ncbi:MAG TPA: hypothetical protein PK668_18620 [Myxococcota bacterium]|nr:hypothetical protein [Myxococcota bacterium]HRY96566.1 hypothetical protein [Myxococcota bacterium]